MWAAYGAWLRDSGAPDQLEDVMRHQERMSEARQALGPGPAKDTERRGTAMTLATAAEFAALLVAVYQGDSGGAFADRRGDR